MPFIPDDVLMEAIRVSGEPNENRLMVLLHYAMLCQNEGTEPEPPRLAESAKLPLDATQDALQYLSGKGWLERVRDYSE